jgi:hypothetical protein
MVILPFNNIYWYYKITMLKKVIPPGLSLPIELMRQIDSERGDIPRSRYVLRILQRQYLSKQIRDKGSLDSKFETLQSSKHFSY